MIKYSITKCMLINTYQEIKIRPLRIPSVSTICTVFAIAQQKTLECQSTIGIIWMNFLQDLYLFGMYGKDNKSKPEKTGKIILGLTVYDVFSLIIRYIALIFYIVM